MNKPVKPQTPELDKMIVANDEGSQQIGAFIDWLRESEGYVLAKWVEQKDHHNNTWQELEAEHPTVISLLGKYFKIDLVEMERERMRLLDYVRAINDHSEAVHSEAGIGEAVSALDENAPPSVEGQDQRTLSPT